MSEWDSVITSLQAGLEQAPNDRGLLLHLGQLLQKANRQDEALNVFQQLLAQEPTHSEALQGAHAAAIASNNQSLAGAYGQLLKALGQSQNSTVDQSPPPPSDPASAKPKEVEKVRGAKLRLVQDSDSSADFVEIEDSRIYLKDVGGMEHVKKRLHLAFLAPLKNPELMKAYGKSVRGGLLLYGPPGCGKTFIARALAGEMGAKFMSIGINDILDMYIGESERKLHEIFETVRRNAPAVLFIDELDAIGQKRSQIRGSGMRSLVNQLLAEMDSLGNENDNVFILSATNHPWDVDSALRRPGRFDRVVAVFPPDLEARKSILRFHLRNKPAADVDVNFLAEKTRLFSGADLAHLCDSAVEYVLEESLDSGTVRPLCDKDFQRPLKEVRPSTRSWFDSARNYAMFANDSGQYDDLLEYIRQQKL